VSGNHETCAEGAGFAVAYGLASALAVFIVSTALTWLFGGRHDIEVWLASALVTTAVSCMVSGPVRSRISARSNPDAGRHS
jgi:hypothetical protein